jgi:hypothetical protein
MTLAAAAIGTAASSYFKLLRQQPLAKQIYEQN